MQGDSWRIVGTIMLPDFRFLAGAVLGTALLAVTGIGLIVAGKIAQQARIGPLEASRALAFAPEHGRPQPTDAVPRFGTGEDPFANLPRSTAPDVILAPKIAVPEIAAPEILAQAPSPPVATEIAAPAEAVASPPDDADTVDERAMVDPPLPAEGEDAQAAAQPRPEPSTEVEHVGSLPTTVALPEPPAAEPIVETPSAAVPVDENAPIADADIIDTLGGDLSGRPVPKAESKAKPAAKQPAAKKAAAKKAKAKPKVRNTRTVVLQPSAWSGYPVTVPNAGTTKPRFPR
jgi:hypothetical protein